MQEIKCPNCGKTFVVDDSGYAQIARQVRDSEFDRALRQRERDIAEAKEKELELAQMRQKEAFDRALAEAERRVEQLKTQLAGSETEKQLAVSEAVRQKEKELSEQASEVAALKNRLDNQETESQLKQQSLQREYESRLRQKDEMIEYYKDFKARQSTKMIGESLEQHCLSQFNALRMTAFPDAYFEKDNDARSGSKGDFIFRESRGGVEFISIMFEMKNEADETATKHKNEDFFKELDKDRREKKCEYAVLVSLLEADSFVQIRKDVRHPPAVFHPHHHAVAQRGAGEPEIPAGTGSGAQPADRRAQL